MPLFVFSLWAFAISSRAQNELPTAGINIAKDFDARLLESEKIKMPPKLPYIDSTTKRQYYLVPPRLLAIKYETPRLRPLAMKSVQVTDNYEPLPGESKAMSDEDRFKWGYSNFVKKRFLQSKAAFAVLKEKPGGEWYYPANYYYGCVAFFEGNLDDAAQSFHLCESSPQYKAVIPYYLSQIYYAKKQFDKVISYGSVKEKETDIRNRVELNQLIGQAYFERGDFKQALPHLEFAATNSAQFRAEDYYQLGYAQYQNGYYKQAIENFGQLSKQDSLFGQNGLYHQGDCYLRTNNRLAARNAFGQAANMDFDPMIKEDAMFNYAKLSYELLYERDALQALQNIPPGSRHFEDAQVLMSEMLMNTRDYESSIIALNAIKNRTPRLNETIQQLYYFRGLQLYLDEQLNEARRYFNKSLENPLNKRTATLCSFWLGNISHETGEYNLSKNHIASFLSSGSRYNDLPEESSLTMGQYIQGYNLLKQGDCVKANTYFKTAIDGIKRNYADIQSGLIKSGVLGDAVLRAGDCHFKQHQYQDALAYYHEAITKKLEGFEYALYQKAFIKGLTGNPLDKIIALEELVDKYPNSKYTDNALYQMGDTYQDMGRLDQAIVPLERLVSGFGGKSTLVNQALLKLGLISYNQGNTTAALNYFKQVFSNNPENIEAKDALAAIEEIYVRDLNRPDEYFAFLETVPGLNLNAAAKDSAKIYSALPQSQNTAFRDSISFQSAEILYQNDRLPQAIDAFSNYLTRYPQGWYALDACYLRANCYSNAAIAKFDLALKDYSVVISQGFSRYYVKSCEKAASIAYNYLRNYGQVLEFARKWEAAATSGTSRQEAQAFILRAAYASNDSAFLIEYVQKTGITSGEQSAVAQYYLGKSAFDRGDYTNAMPALQKVTQTSTSSIMAEAYHIQAQILFRLCDYRKAEDFISIANQASAGYDDWIARNLILLSDIYVALNDKNSAAASLEAVLENYKGDFAIIEEARDKYNKIGTWNTSKKPDNIQPQKPFDLLDIEGN